MKFDFQLAVGAVKLGIGGVIADAVLVADVRRDIAKNSRQLALEAGKVGAPTRQARECLHLIIRLQVVHVADGYEPAGAAMVSLPILAGHEADPDWGDPYILCCLDLLNYRVPVGLAGRALSV